MEYNMNNDIYIYIDGYTLWWTNIAMENGYL